MSRTSAQFAAVHRSVEERLGSRAPGALSPRERQIRERLTTGLEDVDSLLGGGVPLGAITELVGPESSGRTTVACALAAQVAGAGGVCAWVDVADAFDPTSAALAGVDLERVLWVRAAMRGLKAQDSRTQSAAMMREPAPPMPGVKGGGGRQHPRTEANGMPEAIAAMLRAHGGMHDKFFKPRERQVIGTPGAPNRAVSYRAVDREEQVASDRVPARRGERVAMPPRCVEAQPARRRVAEEAAVTARVLQAGRGERHTTLSPPVPVGLRSGQASDELQANVVLNAARIHSIQTGPRVISFAPGRNAPRPCRRFAAKPETAWNALDHALRATDLLLQAGGFGLLVLDLGSTPAEQAWRVPLATWFRYRAACDRSRTSLLLLTQHPCARSSAELVVRMESGCMEADEQVLRGIRFQAEVERRRFAQVSEKVVSIRKPPQKERTGAWSRRAAWSL